MKKLSLSTMIILCSLCTLAQKQELRFSDGKKLEFELVHNDPDNLPKWNINFYCAGAGGTIDFFYGLKIQPKYRFNEKLSAELNIVSPLFKALDGNTQNWVNALDQYAKTSLDVWGSLNYRIFGFIDKRPKNTSVSFTYSDRSTRAYIAKVPRKVRRSLELSLAGGFTRQPAQAYLPATSSSNGISHRLLNYNSHMIMGGLRYFKSQHYKMISNGTKRGYFRSRTIFAYLTRYTKPSYVVARTIDRGSNKYDVEMNVTDGFYAPDITNTGYRFGISKQIGILNSNWTINWSLEYHQIATISSPQIGRSKNITLLLGTFGFGICDKKFMQIPDTNL